MADHPNAAKVREAMEGFNRGDMSAWFDLAADDVVWHEIGGRTLQGKAALEESMTGIEDVELSANLHDVVANDDHVVALVEANVKAGGDEISYRTAELYHMSEGKITERWSMAEDTQAITDFFSKLG